ncbi:MAG: hypothetical protein ABSH51_08270 [Solirubrobacteraceae bacterium]|jgi:hypothetical protein
MRARSIVLAVLAVLAAATVAGCGSSNTPHAAAGDHAGVTFATCMRTHGVPGFPDPEDAADIQIPTILMHNPAPAFTSAMAACQYLVPPGGPPVATAGQKAAALKFAKCMRRHGVDHYPDPTYQDGAEVPPFIADPALDPASPAFGAASKTCQSE